MRRILMWTVWNIPLFSIVNSQPVATRPIGIRSGLGKPPSEVEVVAHEKTERFIDHCAEHPMNVVRVTEISEIQCPECTGKVLANSLIEEFRKRLHDKYQDGGG